MRMAHGEVRNNFLAQNPERFIEITAPLLEGGVKRNISLCFSYYDGPDEEREALAQLPPQVAWEQLSIEVITTPTSLQGFPQVRTSLSQPDQVR